jgi:hypothetical protein
LKPTVKTIINTAAAAIVQPSLPDPAFGFNLIAIQYSKLSGSRNG